MDLDNIKRGLRAEIKKRENEQYATFQCNVRQMCKDVLAKLEEQESVIADKDKQLRYANYKRCLRNAESCLHLAWYYIEVRERDASSIMWKWHNRWLEIADKFKEAK